MGNAKKSLALLTNDIENKEEAFFNTLIALKDVEKNRHDISNQLPALIESLELENYTKDQNDKEEVVRSIITAASIKKQQIDEKEKKFNFYLNLIKHLTPIVSVVLSFMFITWLGGHLQEASFNRKATFDAKLDRYQEAQKQATEILFDVRDAYYRIKWDQDIDPDSTRYHSFIRRQRQELQLLEDIIRGFPERHRQSLNSSILAVVTNMDQFLENNEELDLNKINELRNEISVALIDFLDDPNSR